MTTVKPFLMFQDGKAREAIDFYVSSLPNSRIIALELFGQGGPGPEGTVKRANLSLCGQPVMVTDSHIKHAFTFTPATSLFVDCESDSEIDGLYATLSTGGRALMPLGVYGFSRKFGWIEDRFGVSWQLNLA